MRTACVLISMLVCFSCGWLAYDIWSGNPLSMLDKTGITLALITMSLAFSRLVFP